jgi:hypothetical protein
MRIRRRVQAMTLLSVRRIPRNIIVDLAILISGSAITIAAAPYTDRIKSGFDYCVQDIQKYGPTVFQWAYDAKDRHDKAVFVRDEIGRATSYIAKHWHHSN